MMSRAPVGLVVIGLLFLSASEVWPQAADIDPRWVATRYVASQADIVHLGASLVVDTVYGPDGILVDPKALSRADIASNKRIADRLDASTGTLMSYLQCPETPPEPTRLARGIRQGCRFEGGIEAVIQVGSPRLNSNGIAIWVRTWTFATWPHRTLANIQNYGVNSFSREVLLKKDLDGPWRVVGVGQMRATMW